MTKPLLSLLCLLGLGCEEPVDLGQRDTASGGTTSTTSIDSQPSTGGSPVQTTSRVESLCGNGLLEPGEICDDGNAVSGDGCMADCRKTEATVPSICGNGLLDPGETCDDGNAVSGDGCRADCRAMQVGLVCPTPGVPCQLSSSYDDCGNGIVDSAEACDDGNRSDGDGCSSICRLEAGWTCSSTPSSVCVEVCGDGVATMGEQCDMGVANGDPANICGADCRLLTWCGDGMVGGDEACDQGAANGDPRSGCRADCQVPTTCGNGVVDLSEECDLGATKNDDSYGGCRTDCRLSEYCGDGIVNGPEQCDNAADNGLGDCQTNCTLGVPSSTRE